MILYWCDMSRFPIYDKNIPRTDTTQKRNHSAFFFLSTTTHNHPQQQAHMSVDHVTIDSIKQTISSKGIMSVSYTHLTLPTKA